MFDVNEPEQGKQLMKRFWAWVLGGIGIGFALLVPIAASVWIIKGSSSAAMDAVKSIPTFFAGMATLFAAGLASAFAWANLSAQRNNVNTQLAGQRESLDRQLTAQRESLDRQLTAQREALAAQFAEQRQQESIRELRRRQSIASGYIGEITLLRSVMSVLRGNLLIADDNKLRQFGNFLTVEKLNGLSRFHEASVGELGRFPAPIPNMVIEFYDNMHFCHRRAQDMLTHGVAANSKQGTVDVLSAALAKAQAVTDALVSIAGDPIRVDTSTVARISEVP